MKYLALLFFATMLAGCMGNPEPMPLKFEEIFSKDDNNYLISVSSKPEKLLAGQLFILKIELRDAKTLGAVKHLTYEVQILDEAGKNVFVDSLHAMEGAPYMKDITLRAGKYTLKLVITQGMGADIGQLYETELKFMVKR